MSALKDSKLGLTSSSTGGGVSGVSPPSLPSSTLSNTIDVTEDVRHLKQGVIINGIHGAGDSADCSTSDQSVPIGLRPDQSGDVPDPSSPLYVDAKATFEDEDEQKDEESDEASETDEKHPEDSVEHVGVDNLTVEEVSIHDTSDSNQPPGEFVEPDDETATAVCAQVEELFSDEGVLKESYLMKHIRRNKLGFVSLKVVNSLRKMKRLTRDHRVIAYSITKLSTTLELNENSTKVRRIVPVNLPPVVKSSPGNNEDADNDGKVSAEFRTVVVVNLPIETPLTIEGVAELFGKCGPVTQIRLLRPGSGALEGLGKEVLRNLDKHSLVLDGGRSALIEYETLSAAKRACKMTNKTDWRHGMRVTLLALQPGVKKNGGEDSNNEGEGSGREGSDHKSSDRYDDFKTKKKKKRNSRVNELVTAEALYGSNAGGSIYSSSSSDTEGRSSRWVQNRPRSESFGAAEPIAMGRRTGCPPKTGGGGGGGSPARGSPLMAALHSRHGGGVHESDNDDWRARSCSFGSDLGISPSRGSWSLRRMMQQEGGSSLTGSDATGSQILGRSSPALPLEADSVLRQPRGPDGTRGFRRGDLVSRPQSGKR